MTTDVRIINAQDFVRATPEGRLDLQQSKKLLMDVAATSEPLTDYRIILDTRKAQIEMTFTDHWELAAGLSGLRGAFHRKTAVICPVERFDHAGFFSLCAQGNGEGNGVRVQILDKQSALIGHQPHRVKTFQEEFRTFLAKHKIQFDERYVWD